MVWLSYYCHPAVRLKQKTHRRSAVGYVKSLLRIKNPSPRWSAARS
jgi:hypothetical protein